MGIGLGGGSQGEAQRPPSSCGDFILGGRLDWMTSGVPRSWKMRRGAAPWVIMGVTVTCGVGACPSHLPGHRLPFASSYLPGSQPEGSRVTPITGASLTCFPASSGRWLRTCHLFYCCCLRAGHVLINAPLRAIHMLVQHSSKHPASAESPRSGVSYFPSTFLLFFFFGRGEVPPRSHK